jgi:carbon storage regulator CsrA
MLVLTRRVNEEIVVPQCQLTLTVLEIVGGRVRLGISAPAGVAVHRREVWHRNPAGAALELGDLKMAIRVLIADSDAFLTESYRDDLSRQGAAVATATTGLDCMERLRQFHPDVLVLDPALPWGGGDGVLAILHEQPELRPPFVLLVTHAHDRGLLHRVSRFKVDDFQVKPLPAKRLVQRICTLLVRHEAETVPAEERRRASLVVGGRPR